MAEKGKGKKTPAKDEAGVMSELSATRPPRIGGRRRGAAPAAKGTAKGSPKAAPRSAAKTTSKPAAAKPAAAKPAVAKPAAAKPSKPAGMPSSGGVIRETPTRKPRPVRAGSPGLKRAAPQTAKSQRPPARTAPPTPPAGAPNAPSGTELVTTAIQAAGELAQIGVTVGGQILKRAFDRLPKP